MGWIDRLFGVTEVPSPAPPQFPVNAYTVHDFNDPEWATIIGGGNAAGANVTTQSAMKNSAVRRCVNLISNSIGMLPLQLMRVAGDVREKAKDHPLYEVLSTRPNTYQTAFVFRRLMQHRVLTEGNAFAAIVRSGNRIVSLNPIDPRRVKVEQNDDWTIFYRVNRSDGGEQIIHAQDMFHVMGDSEDGLSGQPLAQTANEVLGLTRRAEEAAARVFRNGVMAGSYLKTDNKLTPEAMDNLKRSMDEEYSGAENAGKNMVLEQGLDFKAIGSTAKDAQNLETRAFQIEEVARLFGVPRPFLMVDDTSWGSGIEQLGIFFVQYGLAPWFVAWEQAIERTLLTAVERKTLYAKFNERALLRGSMADQATFLTKLVGGPGTKPIIQANEARSWLDLPEHPDGGGLSAMGVADGTTGQN